MIAYTLGKTEHGAEWIRCLKCGRTSFNAKDIEQKYCGACHSFHETVESFRTDGYACPKCGAILDAATRASCDGKPEDGSLTVCLYCSNWNVFLGGFQPDDEAGKIAKKVRDERR